MTKYKERIFRIIQIGNKEDLPSTVFDYFISVVIILNIALMTMQTFSQFEPAFGIMRVIEMITIIIFVIEYALRIWTSNYLFPGISKKKAVLHFIFSWDGIVDLFTILPFFFLSGFIVFRMLRVVRILRLFRINSQYDSFSVIRTVLSDKRKQIISSLFILIILMLASSIGMYSAEHEAQPDVFKNAFSGIWWSVSAMLTVGYGDIYPITVMGKLMAIITAFLGVGVVAIPTGIISAGFVEQYTKAKNYTTVAKEYAMRFLSVHVGETHEWNGKYIKDTNLPDGLNIALIHRDDEIIVPRGDKMILSGDRVILVGSEFDYKDDIRFDEVIIGIGHPYVGKAIKELDISRLTTIVNIKRADSNIIPNGETVIEEGDCLIVYTKSTLTPWKDGLD